MVSVIEASGDAYRNSQTIVIAFALGAIALALMLGRTISWSLIGPIREIDATLSEIAAGDFTRRVKVGNRDELGALGPTSTGCRSSSAISTGSSKWRARTNRHSSPA